MNRILGKYEMGCYLVYIYYYWPHRIFYNWFPFNLFILYGFYKKTKIGFNTKSNLQASRCFLHALFSDLL